MQRNRTRSQHWGLVLAIATLASCKAPAPPTPSPEGEVDINGVVHLHAGTRSIALRAADGKSLGDVLVQVGSQTFRLAAGHLDLPASALATIRGAGHGSFRIYAPGYAPRVVRLDDPAADTTLAPLAPAGPPTALGPLGGQASAPGRGLAVGFPPHMLAAPNTAVTLATYPLAIGPGDTTAALAERAALLAAHTSGKSTGAGVLPAGTSLAGSGASPGPSGAVPPAAACDQPLPCPPPTAAQGLEVTVDGPLAAGTLTLSLDLAQLDPAVANRIRATFAAMAATGDPGYAATLQALFGVQLNGNTLTLPVAIGANQVVDGVVQLNIAALEVLGVALQVTIVASAAGGSLPPAAGGTGAPVAGANAATGLASGGAASGGIVGAGGTTLVGDAGAGVISDHGAGVLSNNSGSLIGKVKTPFLGGEAKFALLSYTDYLVPNQVQVGATDVNDQPYGATVFDDAASNYRLGGLPPTPDQLFIKGIGPGFVLRASARAPHTADVTSDLDAATTGAAAWMEQTILAGNATVQGVSSSGYVQDVARLKTLFSQTDAVNAVRQPPDQIAALVQSRLQGGGFLPMALTNTTSFPVGTAPIWLALDRNKRLWVTNKDSSNVTVLNLDGSTYATYPTEAGPREIAFDLAGNAWITCFEACSVDKLSPTGAMLGSHPTGTSTGPRALGVAPDGTVWVALAPLGQVIQLSPQLTELARYATGSIPFGITFTSTTGAGYNVWIADSGSNDLMALSSTGKVLGTYPVSGLAPNGVRQDAQGNFWLPCANSNSVVELSPSGAQLGSFQVGNGPVTLAFDGQGNVWVPGQLDNTVTVLSPTGQTLRTHLAGNRVKDVLVDPTGHVWLADLGGSEVVRLTP